MNALSALLLAVLAVCVLVAPPRKAALALLAGALFLSQGAALDLGGATFFPTRILAYLLFLRVIARREWSFQRMTKMDWAFVVLYLYTTSILLLRPDEAFPLRMAKMLDVFCGYFAFRGLIARPEDLRWLLRGLAFLLVPFVAILAVEFFTGRNLFTAVGAFGGTWLREGRPRCFGTFRHPSLLGSLGATFFPLFVALAFEQAQRARALLGAGLCVAIVIFSNSGAPLTALMVGVVGWLCWQLRENMRTVRWCIAGTIAVLLVIMKAPIWYLPAKISAITGGTGWHRSYLMDVAFRHIGKWWMAGLPLEETREWMPYSLAATGGADITNQYISFGLNGGILAIALFIFFLSCAFSIIGRARARARNLSRTREYLFWALGVTCAVHVANWLGFTYFDQFEVVWLFHAAVIASMGQFREKRAETAAVATRFRARPRRAHWLDPIEVR